MPKPDGTLLFSVLNYPAMPLEHKQQVKVLERAFNIYVTRSKTRGDLWAQFDVHDSIHHLNSKLARVRHACELLSQMSNSPPGDLDEDLDRVEELLEEAIDSFLDIINYAAFGVRHLTGEKPVARGKTVQ